MENVKENIKNNLIFLRKERKLTQRGLAEYLNYSDKAVSRWELGESLPDIDVLITLCKFYGVEFDWLIKKHANLISPTAKNINLSIRILIAMMIAVACFAIATIVFVYCKIATANNVWITFVWSTTISIFLVLLCSLKWWDQLVSFLFATFGLWSLLTSIFLQTLPSVNIWPIYLVGIPLQVLLVLVYILNKKKNKKLY